MPSILTALKARRTSEEEKNGWTPFNETPVLRPADNGSSPTIEELKSLPRVSDNIPYTVFVVVAAEVAERFAYRSITGPMRGSELYAQSSCPNQQLENYIQNPFHGSLRPGALGKVC